MKDGDRFRNGIGDEIVIEGDPEVVTHGHDFGGVMRTEQVRLRFTEGRCKGEPRQWATSYIRGSFAEVKG